jgi:peptide/nickel transport system ATP-binding protein
METGMRLMEVENLYTYYKTRLKELVYAVDGVSLTLEQGKILGIAGESGCGKSTLALSLMGFYFPPLNFGGGQIIINGKDIMSMPYEELRTQILGKEIAYIPQAAMNALNPTRKIIRFIEDIIVEHIPEMTRPQVRKMAEERFQQVNLPVRVLNAYPNELSGGMKQRTVIAISTILHPKILIADEPSSALDVTSQKIVIQMLKGMMKHGYVQAMIFITHELPLLKNVADDILVMYAGEIVEKGKTDEVIFDALHPYARALMGSIIVPEKGMKAQHLSEIPGTPPNLKEQLEGCRFADRCQFVAPGCREPKRIEMRTTNSRAYRCISSVDQLQEFYHHGEQ